MVMQVYGYQLREGDTFTKGSRGTVLSVVTAGDGLHVFLTDGTYSKCEANGVYEIQSR